MDDRIMAFYGHLDENGISNREKIERFQKIIRRTDATDTGRSFDETEGHHDGRVLREGRLIGFGIHILNEDIYPLRRFEIYLRNCDLVGEVDLSGEEELLFVDVYHNRLSSVRVDGDRKLRILGIQDNAVEQLDVSTLTSCQGIDAGKNRLEALDVSRNEELVELYVNDNRLQRVDTGACRKLRYFYCQNNQITRLDLRDNPHLRHVNATGNPVREILALAPQREDHLPLEVRSEGPGYVGLKFNPVYNAQWKETGEWQQSYEARAFEGHRFLGWWEKGQEICTEPSWTDEYGASRVLVARFM
ncbi:MAG: hypothetical protein IJ083_02900 [Clostridia bacterium]|nr:hypothetical protein [Clostridia bacterium]